MLKITSCRYISWSALFAGMVAGVGLNFLLNLLVLALGLASFSVDKQGATEFNFLGFLSLCLTSMIAMFSAGWVAGRLSYCQVKQRLWGVLYGFLAWSLLLIMTIVLITNMIQYTAFHSNFTTNLVSIKLTHSSPMLTETVADRIETSPLNPNVEKRKKIVILNALHTFFLFFLGAIASCLGGYCGFKPYTEPNTEY